MMKIHRYDDPLQRLDALIKRGGGTWEAYRF